MHLNWLGLTLKAALGSAPDAPLDSLGQGAASWDAISGVVLTVAVILSLAATLIMLLGLRANPQNGGAPGAA